MIGLVGTALPAAAQPAGVHRAAPPPGEVCDLPVGEHPAHVYLAARSRTAPSAGAAAATAVSSTISVEYLDGQEAWPAAAIDAFEYAVSLWEATLNAPVPITVEARWADLGGCSGGSFTLGSAGPSVFYRDFPGVQEAATWYPVPLANQMFGADLDDATPEIRARFNAACDDAGSDRWYFGIDARPAGHQIDFVSVVLHELGHGLGFVGTASVTENDPATDADDVGTIGLNGFPSTYDRFTRDGDGFGLFDSYADGTAELADALEGRRGGVTFDGTAPASDLYVPDAWEPGSSYAHLDEAAYHGTDDALMTPRLAPAEAIHRLGTRTCALFEDMGWTLSAGGCDAGLPVELVHFEAVAAADVVTLRWETASETGNAGFAVEHARPEAPFVEVAFVQGVGTTTRATHYAHRLTGMEPGTHRFRLRQVDHDGTIEYGPVVETAVAFDAPFTLRGPVPTPFRERAVLTLAVERRQHVRVDLFDLLGRRVARLHDGVLPAGRPHEIVVAGGVLPAGVYLYRAVGETFATSGSVTRVR